VWRCYWVSDFWPVILRPMGSSEALSLVAWWMTAPGDGTLARRPSRAEARPDSRELVAVWLLRPQLRP